MGNRLPGGVIETLNLLTGNDMYHMFEFTFLRPQVVIVREVTNQRAEIVAFGRKFQAPFDDLWRRNAFRIY